MSQKIVLEIKNIAKEIANSTELNPSLLKGKVSELYNKLVVLEFLEESIVRVEESEKLEVSNTPDKLVVEEEIVETIIESSSDILEFSKEEIQHEIEANVEERVSEKIEEIIEESAKEEISTSNKYDEKDSFNSLNESIEQRKSSLHEELKKNLIQIGLNDRIAFVKRLFDGNQQDFHRVLSQVNTFSTIDEVREFIDTMVRPEHNWENQEEYAERFMEIIEVKFQ